MKKSYLKAYYPDGMTAEERLFNTGARYTRVAFSTWLKVLGIGLAVAVVGLLIGFADFDFFGFGMFVFGVGDLAFLVGLAGMVMYQSGLHCLERAELLYNTRLAANEPEEAEEESPSIFHKASAKPVNTNGWKCTCGMEHPHYVTSCSCGVKKRDLQ